MADTHPAPQSALAPAHEAEHHVSQATVDPNAAPLRADVRETFSRGAVIYCAILGAAAVIGGTIAGLTIVHN